MGSILNRLKPHNKGVQILNCSAWTGIGTRGLKNKDRGKEHTKEKAEMAAEWEREKLQHGGAQIKCLPGPTLAHASIHT